MVIIKANATRHILSFKTAPPVLNMASRRRFRAGRNLPYRDAEPYKSSLYYWWWAFLKRNSLYHKTCIQGGNGLLSKLYRDFGDIYNMGFLTWWDSHQILFAEQCSILAGFKPNILPLNKYGDKRTQSAAAIERHNKQARTSIANQTNRYLRTAGQYIDNVGRGEFPKALRR